MIQFFSKLLKNLDLFGDRIQFCIKNQTEHKSVLSGFLSVALIILFLSISVQGFFDLILRKDINSISADISNVNPPFIDLAPKKFNWAFQFTGGDATSKQFFKVEVAHKVYYRDSNGNITKTTYIREIEPCNENHFNKKLVAGFQTLVSNLSMLWCPKMDDPYFVEGKFTSKNFSFFSFKVSKCINSSNFICASNEEVDKLFKDNGNKVYFNLYTLNNILNLNELDNTVSEFLEDRMFSLIERKLYKEKNIYITSNTILTDSSIYSTNYDKELKTFIFDNDYDEAVLDNTENLNKNNTSYLTIFIRSNFLSKEHKRTVKKYDEFFGFIGGVWSVLVLLFGVIGKAYNKRRLLVKISNSLYTFLPDKGLTKNSQLLSREEKSMTEKKKTLANADISSFYDRIRKYLLKMEGIPLVASLKLLFPKIFWPNEKKNNFRLQSVFFKKAKYTVLKDLDILNVLQKLKEVDKLKELLLGRDERIFFDFISKQIIYEKNDLHLKRAKKSIELFRKLKFNGEDSLFQEVKDYDKLYKGYSNLLRKNVKSRLEKKLIKTIDKELCSIFEQEMKRQEASGVERVDSDQQNLRQESLFTVIPNKKNELTEANELFKKF